MQAGAVRAYTQALLQGTITWARLPCDQWPAHWNGMRDPVCRLRLALYGHPDAGTCWERHCEEKLEVAGFRPVRNWPGCSVHKTLHAFLTVHVDDFKLACAKRHADAAWHATKAQLQLEDPTPLDRYLGCTHQEEGGLLVNPTKTPGRNLPRLSDCFRDEKSTPHGRVVRALRYDMVSFVDQCIDSYKSLAGPDAKPLQRVSTPVLDESTAWSPPEGEPTGVLRNVALKILMKTLYAARMVRPDILRATCMLARRVSKWCHECDRRFHRFCLVSPNNKRSATIRLCWG